MFLILVMAVMTFAYSTSSAFFKSAADQWDWQVFGLGVGCALIGYACNFVVWRQVDLGVAAILISVSQIILVNLIAYFYRGESMTPVQLAGLGFAIVAMILVMLPTIMKS